MGNGKPQSQPEEEEEDNSTWTVEVGNAALELNRLGIDASLELGGARAGSHLPETTASGLPPQ